MSYHCSVSLFCSGLVPVLYLVGGEGGKDIILPMLWIHMCSVLLRNELRKIDLVLLVCLAEKLSCQWVGREAQTRVTTTFQKTKMLTYIFVYFFNFSTFNNSKCCECYSESCGGIRTPEWHLLYSVLAIYRNEGKTEKETQHSECCVPQKPLFLLRYSTDQ